ncbi:major facilitator superfamily domain-containing protein [Aspergillus crustosus]
MQESRDGQVATSLQEGPHLTRYWQPGKPEYLVLGSLALVSLVVALDSTILITALPTISRDLDGTATEAFCLSDIFGRRNSLFVSILLFTIGPLIACLSNNFACLISGRTIQGLGGGGIVVLVLVIATDVIPLRYLSKYQSLVQISWALGTISGPLFGGISPQLTTRCWVFYINFPICGIGLVLVPFTIQQKGFDGTAKQRVARIDFLGAAFGTTFPWGSVHIILPLVIGILGIVGTFAWEFLGSQAPILRPSLFHLRFSIVPYICAAIQGFLLMATFYINAAKRLTPIMTGTALLAATVSLIPASVVSGILITRSGRLRGFIVTGWALTIIATGLLALCDTQISAVEWVWFLIIAGTGHGILVVGHVYAAQANNILSLKLKERGMAGSIATDAVAYAATLRLLPAGNPRTVVLMQGFGDSYKVLTLILTGIAAIGGILSFMVPRYVSGFRSALEGEV